MSVSNGKTTISNWLRGIHNLTLLSSLNDKNSVCMNLPVCAPGSMCGAPVCACVCVPLSLSESVCDPCLLLPRGGRWGGHPQGDSGRNLWEDQEEGAEDKRGPRVSGSEGGETHSGEETGEEHTTYLKLCYSTFCIMLDTRQMPETPLSLLWHDSS